MYLEGHIKICKINRHKHQVMKCGEPKGLFRNDKCKQMIALQTDFFFLQDADSLNH